MMNLVAVVIIGIGASLCIDLWALLLRAGFGVRSLDYCLLGRWALHMTEGTFRHEHIAKSSAKRGECLAGWAAHLSIGVGFAWLFVRLMPDEWLQHPTLLPALVFGVATVVVPFLTIQPGIGLGWASSRVPHPARARLKSVMTHAVFGCGLYVWAYLMRGLTA
ncbi:MAG: DUF2938 domain-containing protein [Gemmatimonadaceae bacterium]